MIDFRVLKNRNFTLRTVSMLVLGFVLYGSTTLLPVLLQTLLGYTAMLSGLVLSPGGVVVIVCMPMVGILLRHFQARWLVIFGVLVSAGGLFIMSRFNLYIDYQTAVWSRVVQSVGHGVPVRAHQHHGVRVYPQGAHELRHRAVQPGAQHRRQRRHRHGDHHAGAAGAVASAGAEAHLTPYDAYRDAIAGASQMVMRMAHDAGRGQAAHGLLYGSMLRQTAMLAFSDAFWVMALLFLLVIPMMFLVKKSGPASGPMAME